MLLYRSKAISTYKELGVEELQWPAEDERELSQEIIRVNPLNRHSILQVNTQFMNKYLHNMNYLFISSYFMAIFLENAARKIAISRHSIDLLRWWSATWLSVHSFLWMERCLLSINKRTISLSWNRLGRTFTKAKK